MNYLHEKFGIVEKFLPLRIHHRGLNFKVNAGVRKGYINSVTNNQYRMEHPALQARADRSNLLGHQIKGKKNVIV